MVSMFVKYCGIHLYVGLSTDDKPMNATNASRFFEMDTKEIFVFDKENLTWINQNDNPEGEKMVKIYVDNGCGYKDDKETPFTSMEDVVNFIGENPIMCIYTPDDSDPFIFFPVEYFCSRTFCYLTLAYYEDGSLAGWQITLFQDLV